MNFIKNKIKEFSHQEFNILENLEKNKKILKEAVLVVGISSLCLILIVIILIIKYKINWKKLLIINIIVLIVIGIVEFSFLTFIAQNYKSFDPNYVKYQIIENLEKIKESNYK